MFDSIHGDDQLSSKLPPARSSAGSVLQHAISVFERLHARHKPMTYKFGITNDAHQRWHHRRYGYKYSRDKYEHMVVLYAANNPHGPAFLEAALINQYYSNLAACHVQVWVRERVPPFSAFQLVVDGVWVLTRA